MSPGGGAAAAVTTTSTASAAASMPRIARVRRQAGVSAAVSASGMRASRRLLDLLDEPGHAGGDPARARTRRDPPPPGRGRGAELPEHARQQAERPPPIWRRPRARVLHERQRALERVDLRVARRAGRRGPRVGASSSSATGQEHRCGCRSTSSAPCPGRTGSSAVAEPSDAGTIAPGWPPAPRSRAARPDGGEGRHDDLRADLHARRRERHAARPGPGAQPASRHCRSNRQR